MRKALVVICIFIGILAYNIYVPEKNTKGLRPDEAAAYAGTRNGEQFTGLLVGVFFGGLSYFGLANLVGHFDKRR